MLLPLVFQLLCIHEGRGQSCHNGYLPQRVFKVGQEGACLGGGHHGEGDHHAVGVLLPHLADQQRAHAASRATSHGVGQLHSRQVSV